MALQLLLPLAGFALGAPSPVPQQRLFTEVGASRGIQPYVMAAGLSSGLAAEDFDDDGDVDLFVPNGLGAPDQLYVNDGTGRFVECAARVGLAVEGNHRTALWFDADGDRDLDLVVAGDCYEDTPCGTGTSLVLHLQQSDGTFVEATHAAGLARDLNVQSDTHVGGLAAGDVDGDGDLDLLAVFWEGLAHLYVNDGSGHFVDRAGPAGIQVAQNHWQPVLHDFDGDGTVDIFQAVDFTENRLWMNQGDGTFVDRAPLAGVDNAFNEMGVALADYDRDGDLDIYVTNIFNAFGRHNVLYERQGAQLAFDEVSLAMDVQDSGCGWGTSFFDADLDGWMDLIASNSCPNRSTRFWRSRVGAGLGFVEATERAGLDGYDGTGTVAFDMDGDGDLDLAQVSLHGMRLFENGLERGADRGYLVVRPRMRGANGRAIGAQVTVFDGTYTTKRVLLAGSSAQSQEPAEAHFGLGAAARVDVTIRWPDGRTRVLTGVAANSVLTIGAP